MMSPEPTLRQSKSNAHGTLFLITASSGVGKTSLIKEILSRIDTLCLSVSYTTRPPRVGERDGFAYHFVEEHVFSKMIEEEAFVEHANVFGHHYGTAWSSLSEPLAQGKDVLLEIDWQGAQQVRKQFPDAVSIYLLPPSQQELERRLRGRGKDADDVIERRLASVAEDIKHINYFDYWVVNEDFASAVDDLGSIFRAECLKKGAQARSLSKILDNLSKDV